MSDANDSILTSTKQILGLADDYTVFDVDIITHINAAFSVVNQLGVGPENGFFISDKDAKWIDIDLPPNQLSLLRTYIFLKTRFTFDPPSTGYLVEAMQKQLNEYEWRLNTFREDSLQPQP